MLLIYINSGKARHHQTPTRLNRWEIRWNTTRRRSSSLAAAVTAFAVRELRLSKETERKQKRMEMSGREGKVCVMWRRLVRMSCNNRAQQHNDQWCKQINYLRQQINKLMVCHTVSTPTNRIRRVCRGMLYYWLRLPSAHTTKQRDGIRQ